MNVIIFAQWGVGLEAVKFFAKEHNVTVVTCNVHDDKYGALVYSWSLDNKLCVLDYLSEKNVVEELDFTEFELLVSCGFGRKIPSFMYQDIHNFNVHQSILPKYRGPDPVSNAILSRDDFFGFTTHKLTDKFDEGDIYCQLSWPVVYDENLEFNVSIFKQNIGFIIGSTLNCIKMNVTPYPQHEQEASYAGKVGLDWNKTLDQIVGEK